MSDVDIESEKYRSLGKIRFTIGALQRIAGLRHYAGKFSYLAELRNKMEDGEEQTEEIAPGVNLHVQNGGTTSADGDINIIVDAMNETLEEAKRSTDNPQTVASASSEFDRVKFQRANTVPALSNQVSEHLGLKDNFAIGPPSTIPNLSEDLPDSWKTIEGEFVTIGGVSLTHLGYDMYSSPDSLFDDGLISVQIIRKGISKTRMLQLFTSYEKGTHLQYPELESFDVKAFRLEPGTNRIGYICVDGEIVDYGPIQVEMLPSFGSIIMMPTR